MKISWFTIAAGIVAAGVIHVAAVLGAPYLARQDAWGRLAQVSSVNQVYLAPPGKHETKPLPLTSPDMGYAYCRFDLTQKNVVFESKVSSPIWSAAIHTRHGENFYVISGADIQRDHIRMLLVPRERLALEASAEISAQGEQQIIVISPEMRGTITVRVPTPDKPYTQRTKAALEAAQCGSAEEIDLEPEPKQTPPGFPPLPAPRVPAVMTLSGGAIN